MFKSRLKDFLYLIALRVFSNIDGSDDQFIDKPILENIAKRVNEIKTAYTINDFSFDKFQLDFTYQQKAIIHEFTFNNYFHNGELTYVEQDIDKFIKTFKPFEKLILDNFGFDIEFLINIYLYSEEFSKKKFQKSMEFAGTDEFIDLRENALSDNKSFIDIFTNMSEEVRKQFTDFMDCSHDFLKFSKTDYYTVFPKQQVDTYLDLFSIAVEDDSTFLFYSDENPLDLRPIIRLSDNEYLNIYQKQLPIAFYKFFYRFCNNQFNNSERLQKHRGIVLENKCHEIFKEFFLKEKHTFFYRNYFLDKHYEQDLLILTNGTALIIETKASKFREPLRNMDKAFSKIKDDFKDNIQVGYEQCLRAKKKFELVESFPIYDKNGNILYKINPKKIHNIFTIIVTLERLGLIQQDLSFLLDIKENERYPFSINIDDLEVFLRALRLKSRNPRQDLITYLQHRELLHGRLYCYDELDICAYYLSNKKQFINHSKQLNSTFYMMPDNQDYFDDLYFQGVGLFKNELNLEEKKSNIYMPIKGQIKAFQLQDFTKFK